MSRPINEFVEYVFFFMLLKLLDFKILFIKCEINLYYVFLICVNLVCMQTFIFVEKCSSWYFNRFMILSCKMCQYWMKNLFPKYYDMEIRKPLNILFRYFTWVHLLYKKYDCVLVFHNYFSDNMSSLEMKLTCVIRMDARMS